MAKKKIAETIIFGGHLTTIAGEGGSAVCTYMGANAMVIDGCEGACTAPVPAGYTVA